jgi:hypothetical protein
LQSEQELQRQGFSWTSSSVIRSKTVFIQKLK